MPRRETTRSGRTKYRRWTPEEDELILKRPPSEISRLIGRSFRAVHCRRAALRKKLTGPDTVKRRPDAYNERGLLKAAGALW
jgi:hypothetical protein